MKGDHNLLRMVMLMDLASFAQRALEEILPGVDVKWNWHLYVICSMLTDLANGKIQRLLICVPPRSLKSLLCSIIYPAWLLARAASETILCVNYAQSLSEVQRTNTLEWVRSTLATRSNDKLNEKQLLIMQRLHEEDVAPRRLRSPSASSAASMAKSPLGRHLHQRSPARLQQRHRLPLELGRKLPPLLRHCTPPRPHGLSKGVH